MAATGNVHINIAASMTPASPLEGSVKGDLDNGTRGQSFTNGTGSGNIDTVYRAQLSIGASATTTLNFLSAGSLSDLLGGTVDLDELKWFGVKVVSGSIEVAKPSSNGLAFLKAAADALVLTSGQAFAIDLAAAGIDVTSNSQIEITDTAGGSGSVVEVSVGGAS